MSNFHINSIRTVEEIIGMMNSTKEFNQEYLEDLKGKESVFSIQLKTECLNFKFIITEYLVERVLQESIAIKKDGENFQEKILFLNELDSTKVTKTNYKNEIFFTKYENLDFYLNKILSIFYQTILKTKEQILFVLDSIKEYSAKEFFVEYSLHTEVSEMAKEVVTSDYKHVLFTIYKTEGRYIDLRRVHLLEEELDNLASKLGSPKFELLFETNKEITFSVLIPLNLDIEKELLAHFDNSKEVFLGELMKVIESLDSVLKSIVEKEVIEFVETDKEVS